MSKGSNCCKSDDNQGATICGSSSQRGGSDNNFCSLHNLNHSSIPKNQTVVGVHGNITDDDEIIAGSDACVPPLSNHYRGSPTKERSCIRLHIRKDKVVGGSSQRGRSGNNFCSLYNLNCSSVPKNQTVVGVRGNGSGDDEIIAGVDADVHPLSNHYCSSPTKERSCIGLHIGKDKVVVCSNQRGGSGNNFLSLCNLNHGSIPKNQTVVGVRGNVTGDDEIIAGSDADVHPLSNHYCGSPTKERSCIGLYIGKDKVVVGFALHPRQLVAKNMVI